MLAYMIALVRDLPKLREMEYSLSSKSYWLGSPKQLKDALTHTEVDSTTNYDEEPMVEIIVIYNEARELFTKLPLDMQLKHIFNTSRYSDSCSYIEDYQISSRASQCVMFNRLLMSYAEIMIPKLNKDERANLVSGLEQSLKRGGFMGSTYYEQDELTLLLKWKLDNELPEKTVNKKPMKI